LNNTGPRVELCSALETAGDTPQHPVLLKLVGEDGLSGVIRLNLWRVYFLVTLLVVAVGASCLGIDLAVFVGHVSEDILLSFDKFPHFIWIHGPVPHELMVA